MKKTFLILSVVVMAMFACVSCNGNKEKSSDNKAESEAGVEMEENTFSPSDIDWNLIREFRSNRNELVNSDETVEYTVNMDSCIMQYRILSQGIAKEGGMVKLTTALKQTYPEDDVNEVMMFITDMDGFARYAQMTPDWENNGGLPNELIPLTPDQLKEVVKIKKSQRK